VKFLLVPLLIVGMFFSFTAALVAMLFWTKTVETPQQLVNLVMGGQDSTDIFDEFSLKDDELSELFALADTYKTRYEQQAKESQVLMDSLTAGLTALQVEKERLAAESVRLESLDVQQANAQRSQSLDELAKFYAKIKPANAAEILQQEAQLSDTTVAELLRKLPAQQMGKIMANMLPERAAKITKLMQELAVR
jgi:flagellar motility protein MotE (MotC chaperone)